MYYLPKSCEDNKVVVGENLINGWFRSNGITSEKSLKLLPQTIMYSKIVEAKVSNAKVVAMLKHMLHCQDYTKYKLW